MTNLYELICESKSLLSKLEENGGELTSELEAALIVHLGQVTQKVDNYALLMERVELDAQYLRQKAAAIESKARSLENLHKRLKDLVKQAMLQFDQNTLEGEHSKFVLVRSNPKLEINEELLPPRWLMEKISLVPDKEMIKEELAQGKTIPGARLLTSFALRKSEK